MAEMFVGKVTPPTILWACLHLALSHLLRYHCQNRATTGLLARVVLLKSTMTSTLSIFYIVTASPKSHMHWSNYWHSVTGPEHGKWHQNVPPTLSPSQPAFGSSCNTFPFSLGEALCDETKNDCVERLLSALTKTTRIPATFSWESPIWNLWSFLGVF